MQLIDDHSPCRNCSHIFLYHINFCNTSDGINKIPFSELKCNEVLNPKRESYVEEMIFCECKEYIPSDNLEYLEYKVEKKNAS